MEVGNGGGRRGRGTRVKAQLCSEDRLPWEMALNPGAHWTPPGGLLTLPESLGWARRRGCLHLLPQGHKPGNAP